METNDRPLGWTTKEEGAQLIKAGLKLESADMYYVPKDAYTGVMSAFNGELLIGNPKDSKSYKPTPCWSLGKLKSLLPREIDGCRWITSSIAGDLASIAYLGNYGQTLCAKTRHTEIEAVVAMVLDLLNKEYID